METHIVVKLARNRLVRALFLLLCLMLSIGIVRSVWSLAQKKGIVGERQAVLQELEVKNKELKQRLEEATSSAFVEKQAREKLGLVREGETVVILDKAKIQAIAGAGNSMQVVMPLWRQWWKLFF